MRTAVEANRILKIRLSLVAPFLAEVNIIGILVNTAVVICFEISQFGPILVIQETYDVCFEMLFLVPYPLLCLNPLPCYTFNPPPTPHIFSAVFLQNHPS